MRGPQPPPPPPQALPPQQQSRGLTLIFSATADSQRLALRNDRALRKRSKAVEKAIRFLAQNLRHPGLKTHEWKGRKCPHGDKLFEAYAENLTPGAYRIFFCYPPDQQGTIFVVAITPHP